jgi:hypothetical protein
MTARRTYPKSTCCIPGCPRWSRLFPGEWLCARHWRMVPRRCRGALRKVWAALRDMPGPESTRGGSPERLRWARYRSLDRRLWDHAVRRVILQEAGL